MSISSLPAPDHGRLTLDDLRDLPPTLDGRQVAEILGCSYWSLLEQVKFGRCPVEPLRLGRNLRWPTVAVLRVIGIDSDAVLARGPRQ
jgi:hypothetical protein